jgi:hypothetical protein
MLMIKTPGVTFMIHTLGIITGPNAPRFSLKLNTGRSIQTSNRLTRTKPTQVGIGSVTGTAHQRQHRIVGAIWGFIEGVTTTGQTIHGFGDHLILGLLGAMLGAIAGILANTLPFFVLALFVLIVMCAAICGINMGFSALLKGFLGRRMKE